MNVPLLVGTLVVLGALAPLAYAWRTYQVKRSATALLERADALEQEQDWDRASAYIFRYLQLRPGDDEARVRLASVFDRSADDLKRKSRSIELHYRALGVAPAERQIELRRRLAELLVEVGRFVEAEAEAETLLEADEQDPAGLRLVALARYGQFQSGALSTAAADLASVSEAFERAVPSNPHDVPLAGTLAHIYRQEPSLLTSEKRSLTQRERETLADAVMDNLVKQNADKAHAYLARFQYRDEFALRDASADLDRALELGADDLVVRIAAAEHERTSGLERIQRAYWLATGSPKAQASREGASEWIDWLIRENEADHERLLARGHFARAVAHFARAVELAPTSEVAYLGLGEAYHSSGDAQAAIATWRQGLKQVGQHSVTLQTRLVVTLIDEGRLPEAETALANLDKAIAAVLPSLTPTARLAMHRSKGVLQAKLMVQRAQPTDAIPLLRRAVASQANVAANVTEQFQAWLLLANAYQSLGEWDQSALALDEAAKLDPEVAAVRAGAARAWLAADRPDVAVQRCYQARQLEFSPETDLLLARAQLQLLVTRPVADRRWESLEAGLGDLDRYVQQGFLGDAWRVLLLRCDFEIVRATERGDRQSGMQRARPLLDEVESKFGSDPIAMQRLVLAYEAMGLANEADRVLNAVQELSSQTVETVALRARILAGRGQHDEARAVLDEAIAGLPAEEGFLLRYQRVHVSLRSGEYERALGELTALHQTKPEDIRLLRQLAELALEARRYEEAAEWTEKLSQHEGRDGSHVRYYRARQLLAQADGTDDARFRQAVEDQTILASTRPAWPETFLLKGLIEQRRGRFESAVEAYATAIDLGEQRVAVFEQIIGLLEQLGRPADAERYLARLSETVPISQTLTVFESNVAIRKDDPDRAVAIARRGVASRPDDPMARVWLGRVLLLAKKSDEAEAEFLKAVEIAPGDLRSWNGLFTYYRTVGKLDDARKALDSMTEKSELSPAQRAFILAQGCELLGDDKGAEANYREAQRLAPSSVAVQMRLAGFYLLRDLVAAEQCLRRVLDVAPDSHTARRALAAILATRGGEEEWNEIERLLSHTSDDDVSVAGLDQRLQAVLLVQRQSDAAGAQLDHLRRAQTILEGLARDPRVAVPGDNLLLAQLHERLSRFETTDRQREARLRLARDQFINLVARERPEPSHVALFVEFLIRNRFEEDAKQWIRRLDEVLVDRREALDRRADPDPTERNQFAEQVARHIDLALRVREPVRAAPWLDRLEADRPDSFRTLTLRVRWLQASDRGNEIEPLVESFTCRLLAQITPDEKDAQKAQQQTATVCLTAGTVYVSIGLDAAAERWYRQLLEIAPERFEPLALSLARPRDPAKLEEAIALCARAAEKDPSTQPAVTLAAVLTAGKPQPADFAGAEPVLAKALAAHRDDVSLLFAVASVRIVEGRGDDAVQLFRRVIRLRPQHVLALNNLATVLGDHASHRQEALELIDRALQITGLQPALYDTKGMILVLDGQTDEALRYLETAVASTSADPRYRFHLAVAYKESGAMDRAKEELVKAIDGNLEDQILTGTDQRLLVELKQLIDE